MAEKIRIAVGTEPRTEIARKVLEFSIRSHTKSKVEFYPLFGEDFDNRGKHGEGTGFSLLRFSLPEKFSYQGKVIYLDADMLVLKDIAELWNIDKKNKINIVWCKYGNEHKSNPETSVMLINCESAKNKIKTLEQLKLELKEFPNHYQNIMKLKYLDPPPLELSKWWNVMDKNCVFSKIQDFGSGHVKLLHYSDIRKQPWFVPTHPYGYIWGKWLKKTYKSGFISLAEIKNAVQNFNIENPKRPNGLHPYWLKELTK